MHDAAVPVSKDWRLAVSWSFDVAFQKKPIVPERVAGFTRRGTEGVREIRLVADDAHPFATATGDCLDEKRIAEPPGCGRERLARARRIFIRGHHRHARGSDGAARQRLVAHRRDGVRTWADKNQSGLFGGTRERRILSKKTVARMDRVGAA